MKTYQAVKQAIETIDNRHASDPKRREELWERIKGKEDWKDTMEWDEMEMLRKLGEELWAMKAALYWVLDYENEYSRLIEHRISGKPTYLHKGETKP